MSLQLCFFVFRFEITLENQEKSMPSLQCPIRFLSSSSTEAHDPYTQKRPSMRSNNSHSRCKPDFSFQRADRVLVDSCLDPESRNKQEVLAVCPTAVRRHEDTFRGGGRRMVAQGLLSLCILCVCVCVYLCGCL